MYCKTVIQSNMPSFRSCRAALRVPTGLALAALLLTACSSIPVSSLWKLRQLNLETLDPVALRAAVAHHPQLRLDGAAMVLTVSVSRKVRLPNGSASTERLEEQLPLQEVRSIAERSVLAEHDGPQSQVQVWRIDPAAAPKLQALRTRALAWKGTDDGQRELSLGLEMAGCLGKGAASGPYRRVSTLIRFTEPGEFIPIVRQIDLAETMPANEWLQRFPPCKG